MTPETIDIIFSGIGACATAVGVIIIIFQLRQQNHQRKLELGNFYIQRFWEIDDGMLRERKGTDPHRHEQHRYLRLCEDEYDAARNKWLDKRQWSVWHEWLTSKNGATRLRQDLEACDPTGTGFPSIRACVEQTLDGFGDHSVKECSAMSLKGTSSSVPA